MTIHHDIYLTEHCVCILHIKKNRFENFKSFFLEITIFSLKCPLISLFLKRVLFKMNETTYVYTSIYIPLSELEFLVLLQYFQKKKLSD